MKNFFTYFFKGKLFLPIVFRCGHWGKLALIYQYGEVENGRKMEEYNFAQGVSGWKLLGAGTKQIFTRGTLTHIFWNIGLPRCPLNLILVQFVYKKIMSVQNRRANDFMMTNGAQFLYVSTISQELKIHFCPSGKNS